MNDKNAAIGVFDSGVGGLTVAREIRQLWLRVTRQVLLPLIQ